MLVLLDEQYTDGSYLGIIRYPFLSAEQFIFLLEEFAYIPYTLLGIIFILIYFLV